VRLLLLVSVLFSSAIAFAADRQINQISVEQSDSDTIIRLYGSGLIRSQKDRLFFAAEASSYSLEPMMMYGDEDYVEVALAMKVAAGQYRISIGPNENTATLESMVVIGAIGPRGEQGPEGEQGPQGETGPAGADGADGAQGPQGETGPAGADGADGAQGPQGEVGPQGEQGPAGADGADGAQGPQGPQGLMGPPGATGPQGPAGPQGPVGPQGPAGDSVSAELTSFLQVISQQSCGNGQVITGLSLAGVTCTNIGVVIDQDDGGGSDPGGLLVIEEMMPGSIDDYRVIGDDYRGYHFATKTYVRGFPTDITAINSVEVNGGYGEADHSFGTESGRIDIQWSGGYQFFDFEDDFVDLIATNTGTLAVVDRLGQPLYYSFDSENGQTNNGQIQKIMNAPPDTGEVIPERLRNISRAQLDIYPPVDACRFFDFSGLDTILDNGSQLGVYPSSIRFGAAKNLFNGIGSNTIFNCFNNEVGTFELTLYVLDGVGNKVAIPLTLNLMDEARVGGELVWNVTKE